MKPRQSTGPRFRRCQRLTRSTQFGRVMSHARRSSDEYFTVLARANDLDHARLGLAISRKAARRAVDRNRLKRIAREAFRHGPTESPLDVVVFAKPAARGEHRHRLRLSLDRHFVTVAACGVS